MSFARTDIRTTEYRIDPVTNCWIWLKAISSDGYGVVWWSRKVRYVHIIMYEKKYGPVPENHELHHTCEQRACINPDHVHPVTRADHRFAHMLLRFAGVRK